MNHTSTERFVGWLSIGGALGFAVIVEALDVLQQGYDNRSQFISEHALGQYGWALLPAFCSLSLSVFGVQHALRRHNGCQAIRVLLAVAALSLLGAGFFRMGDETDLHVVFAFLSLALILLAMYLLPLRVRGHRPTLSRRVSWGLGAGVGVGIFGANALVSIGSGQRIAVACILFWICLLAWQVARR